MKLAVIATVAALALLAEPLPAQAGVPYKIVTADPRGTYFAIGNDLAKMVAPQAGIDLEVMATSGSAENIKLLRPGYADDSQIFTRETEEKVGILAHDEMGI